MAQMTPDLGTVKLRLQLEVGKDLTVVDHIHGTSVIAEHNFVGPLKTTPVFRLLVRVRARLNILGKGRPFHARWLKELNAQHERPSRDKALRSGVENSEHGA